MIQRLPAFLRPRALPFSHVIAINGDGEVVANFQDPDARYPTLTGVLETHDAYYLTTIFGSYLPRIDKQTRLVRQQRRIALIVIAQHQLPNERYRWRTET